VPVDSGGSSCVATFKVPATTPAPARWWLVTS
jgi:hypothetical protein